MLMIINRILEVKNPPETPKNLHAEVKFHYKAL